MNKEYFKYKIRLIIANEHLDCIEEVLDGSVRVNDFDTMYDYNINLCIDTLKGKYDHTFTFKQRMHFLNTGMELPLL